MEIRIRYDDQSIVNLGCLLNLESNYVSYGKDLQEKRFIFSIIIWMKSRCLRILGLIPRIEIGRNYLKDRTIEISMGSIAIFPLILHIPRI